jgi:hypothetical protein
MLAEEKMQAFREAVKLLTPTEKVIAVIVS